MNQKGITTNKKTLIRAQCQLPFAYAHALDRACAHDHPHMCWTL